MPRLRRACVGELIQIDGCDHEWFEARGPRATLLVFVDDATSQLMELRFARSESTFEYFAAATRYLQRHGKPMAFYSDKASIFRVNANDAKGGDGFTQFGLAMHDLNIDVICANSPAAKGRVERAHQTLQDRLVKELRLHGISDREAGNEFLERFRNDYNGRFARPARNDADAHRALSGREDFRRVFSLHEERRLTTNLTLHYRRVMYIVDPTAAADKARGLRVSVREEEDGAVHIEFNGEVLMAHAFPKDARMHQGAIVDNKLLGDTLRLIQKAQNERDHLRLENQRMTLHEDDALRRAMGEPGLPNRRKNTPKLIRTGGSVETGTPAERERRDPLAHVLEWAKQQSSTTPATGNRSRKAKRVAPQIAEHSPLDQRVNRLRNLLA